MESPPDQGSTINNAASFVDGVVTSEYEQLRLENIRRNQEFLKSLGLDVDGPIVTTRDTAKRRENRRKRSSVVVEVSESIQPMRRSRRLSKVAGETADNEEELYFLDDHEPRIAKPPTVRVVSPEDLENEIDISQERKRITAPMLRQFIIDSNPQHEEEISNEMITHTAHRMSYMSNKALVTRLNAVSRSASSKSYEKLLIFYYALALSGLEQLAMVARRTLERIGVEMAINQSTSAQEESDRSS